MLDFVVVSFGTILDWQACLVANTHNPIIGMKMMKVVLSQLTCLYQFFTVMGCSVM